ncbi:hypothetical protein LTS18_012873, partial [Coniosporium uncinatum]
TAAASSTTTRSRSRWPKTSRIRCRRSGGPRARLAPKFCPRASGGTRRIITR